MATRRSFLKRGLLGGLFAGTGSSGFAQRFVPGTAGQLIVISTWQHGMPANAAT